MKPLSDPKISVIIPAYNHEKYLKAAITSVLNQTISDFELIIINDGSTDNSEAVIKSIKDSRIRYFYQENQGAHHTLNRGVELARGEYVSVLNSDDLYDITRLEECLNILETNASVHAVFSHIEFIDEHGAHLEYKHGAADNWQNHDSETSFKDEKNILLDLLAGNFLISTSNLFCRKNVFERIGFFSALRYAHDYDFFLRLCYHFKVCLIEKPILKYRIHSANTFSPESLPETSFEVGLILSDFFLTHDLKTVFGDNEIQTIMLKFFNSVNTFDSERMIMTLLVFGLVYREHHDKSEPLTEISPCRGSGTAFKKACINHFKARFNLWHESREAWKKLDEINEQLTESRKRLSDAEKDAEDNRLKYEDARKILHTTKERLAETVEKLADAREECVNIRGHLTDQKRLTVKWKSEYHAIYGELERTENRLIETGEKLSEERKASAEWRLKSHEAWKRWEEINRRQTTSEIRNPEQIRNMKSETGPTFSGETRFYSVLKGKRMFDKIKTRIKNYIDREIRNGFSQLLGAIEQRDAEQLWESRITLAAPPKVFANLPDVSLYSESGVTYIHPEDMELEQDITVYIQNDKRPLPAAEDREGYAGDRHYEYWLSGLRDYLNIKKNLARHGYQIAPGDSVYEMGCASGRVLRHFLCQETGIELWASDINPNHVEWVLKYLRGNIKVFQNHALPHLPLPDNSVDLICAFSVFTHIDVFELAWLLELRRILRPEGIAYLTAHTDHTWSVIREEDDIYKFLMNHPEFSPDLLKSGMPSERIVYSWPTHNCYRSNVFHHADYIKEVWGKYFNVLEIVRGGHFYQDVILLKKDSAKTRDKERNPDRSSRIYSRIEKTVANDEWKSGLADEADYWDKWIETKGMDWPDEFEFRCNPNSELQSYLCDFINAPEGSQVSILDVGAGPLTCLGKCWPGRKVNIFAVDALAEEYDKRLSKHNIIPPVRTSLGYAEELTSVFARDSFDLVHARNSIDHCYNPRIAVRQMAEVVRPGGIVALYHSAMEGKREEYEGLHQWDFFVHKGNFMVKGPDTTVNISRDLEDIARVTCSMADNWLTVIIRKL